MEEAALVALLERIFIGAGCASDVARCLAANCAACERDGSKSHGIFRLRGYVSTIASGWVDPRAIPVVEDVAPAFLRVDACNGFTQPALAAVAPLAVRRARENGACVIAIRNSHHLSALWPDIEPFAEQGLVAFSVINSMAVTVPSGGKKPLFGTNPVAFAAPAANRAPFVFDMATSAWSHGDVQIARREGRALPDGVGVDRNGVQTHDPAEVLDGGALLPFGGHKGSAISMMVELLGAALTGGKFSSEVDWSQHPGAVTPHTGQFIMLIDTEKAGGAGFALRSAQFMDNLRAAGLSLLPGERRYRNRAKAQLAGIALTQAEFDDLQLILRECT